MIWDGSADHMDMPIIACLDMHLQLDSTMVGSLTMSYITYHVTNVRLMTKRMKIQLEIAICSGDHP